MKRITLTFLCLLLFSFGLFGQRIKDIAYFKGASSTQVIGYGLVVGLAGSGDTYRSSFTVQSVSSMLKRFGITVPQTNLRTRNVAAVMVTARLESYLKEGSIFDVTVSSMGDASSLQGGTLLMTPLSGMDDRVYGFAQGSLSIGGYDISTSTGGRVAKNHALAGRIPGGGVLETSISTGQPNTGEVSVMLREPDFTTANNIAQAINTSLGNEAALAIDPSEVRVQIPQERRNNQVQFLAALESIQVLKDVSARVVVNERTGTIVSGNNVRINPSTISHGNLTITISSYPIISQPGAFSNGSTVVLNNLVPTATESNGNTVAIEGASNVQEVAAALNSLKVAPRDIIAIFQALKEAGALAAELIII